MIVCRDRISECRGRTQKVHHCGVFYPGICKTPNAWIVFLQKFCDFNSFEEKEMDTKSLYLVVAQDCLKIASNRTWQKFETTSKWLTVALPLLQIPATIFFLAFVVPNISNMINESLDYLRKKFVALKWLVCAVKHIAALIRAQTKASSVARDSTKERWRKLVLDTWKSIGAYWTRKALCSQLIEASELSNIQSARTNKLNEVYHTSILKKLYSMMAFTQNHFFCKWNDNIIIILFLISPQYIIFFQPFYIALSG